MPFSDDEAFLPSLRRGRYAFQICMLGIRAGREQDASGIQRSNARRRVGARCNR